MLVNMKPRGGVSDDISKKGLTMSQAVYAIKKFMLSLSLIFILVPKWKLIYQCLLPLVLLKRHADLCALCM
jgi:hypothetical protein